jgi:hypothetical protein
MYTQGKFSVVLMEVLVGPIKMFMESTTSIFVHNSKLQQSWERWAQTMNILVVVVDI